MPRYRFASSRVTLRERLLRCRRSRAWLAVAHVLVLLFIVGKSTAAKPVSDGRIVCLMATSPASTRELARLEALRIHLTDVAASVLVESPEQPVTSTYERVNAAVTLGRHRNATAVLFVEELGESELRLYWVQPQQGRAWIRRISIGSDGDAAVDERAALIARGGVEELLEAGTMSQRPVAPVAAVAMPQAAPAGAAKPPVPAPRPRFRAGVLYQGTLFAHETSWQNGLQALLAARLTERFYLTGKHTFTQPVTFARGAVAGQLARRPSELALGYRSNGQLALRSELGVFADYVVRSTTRVGGDQAPTPARGRVLWGSSLRLGLELQVAPRIRLVGMAGAEFLLNGFDYLTDDSSASVALKLRRVRPLIETGLLVELW